ncbi:MAG: peptide-methionine (S)-S-oxide reductase MsrA [Candidatus Saccharimonadales bacterium]
MQKIVLGGGCFWCLEASFKLINGIEAVVSGYAGGAATDAEYYAVGSGSTGHAEVVEITFNPEVISLDEVLDIFWAIHNPTTLNQQGNDVGPQYRSVIFYADEQQKNTAQASIEKAQELWDDAVVTQLTALEKFYPAEPEHQDYFENNPGNGYCQVIINPKLQKLRQQFADRIKESQ